jgi:hypothetical protein
VLAFFSKKPDLIFLIATGSGTMKYLNKIISILILMLFSVSCTPNLSSIPTYGSPASPQTITPILIPSTTSIPSPDTLITTPDQITQPISILVDDFDTQPVQGPGTAYWPHNRLDGDRGIISNEPRPDDANFIWGKGVVKAMVSPGSNVAGVWTSLNHPIFDCEPLNFDAIFPEQIEPQYQGRIISVRIQVLDGHGTFHVELKLGEKPSCDYSTQKVINAQEFSLTGGPQTFTFNLPEGIGKISNLNWYVSGNLGDYVVVSRVELVADMPLLTAAQQAFLWNYSQLLSNWSHDSGLTRDQGYFAAGQYDNISASGLQTAAAVMAYHLGFISKTSAVEIVSKTSQGLMDIQPDGCAGSGLWPHFVTNGTIALGTEWSSIDTVIASISTIESEQALGLDTAQTESVLRRIDWKKLTLLDGHISHGYWSKNSGCVSIEPGGSGGWQDFGTESWIVNLGEATSNGKTAIFTTSPPTVNGGGFIDELAWLLIPIPERDRWGFDWQSYSQKAADSQLAYYQNPVNKGGVFYRNLGLFGLTPAESPDLSVFPPNSPIFYLDFGVGGKDHSYDGMGPLSDGNGPSTKITLGHAVIVPHYAGIISALRPAQAMNEWKWLVANKLESPLNTAESLMCTDEADSTCSQIVWNARKGAWELGLATLGWARYLVGDENPLYQGFQDNSMLLKGYQVMLEH